MKRLLTLILILLLLAGLGACGGPAAVSPSPPASPEASVSPASPTIPPSVTPSAEPQIDYGGIYLDFLSERYNELHDAFMVGIAGVGFVDLDLDGAPELILFDSGASASMGLQFFDIVDGAVECVSANLTSVSETFGGGHVSRVYVNANYFEDLRLKISPEGGRFFVIESGNGAADFSYTELVRFGSDDGVLTLESLLYKYEEYDLDSGDVVAARCSAGAETIDLDAYEQRRAQFMKENADAGFTCAGKFIWEDKAYDDGCDGLLAMAGAALELYEPAI